MAMYGQDLVAYDPLHRLDFVNVRDLNGTLNFGTKLLNLSLLVTMKLSFQKIIWSKEKLWNETVRLGKELRNKLGLQIDDLSAEGSAFFKKVYWNPPRSGAFVTEKGTDGITRYKVLK